MHSGRQSDYQRPPQRPGQYSKDAEYVVKQINAKYDQLMVELKRYKDAQSLIEQSLESSDNDF